MDRPDSHDHHPQILSASTTLLGISLGIITALRLTNFNGKSLGDEVAWLSALMFLVGILNAFVTMRSPKRRRWQNVLGDWIFLTGVGLLTLATVLVGVASR